MFDFLRIAFLLLAPMLCFPVAAPGQVPANLPRFDVRSRTDVEAALPRVVMSALGTPTYSVLALEGRRIVPMLLQILEDPGKPYYLRRGAVNVLAIIRDSVGLERLLTVARGTDLVAWVVRAHLVFFPYPKVCDHHRASADTATSTSLLGVSAQGLGFCGDPVGDIERLQRLEGSNQEFVRDMAAEAIVRLQKPPGERWRGLYYFDEPPDGTGVYHPPPWMRQAMISSACDGAELRCGSTLLAPATRLRTVNALQFKGRESNEN